MEETMPHGTRPWFTSLLVASILAGVSPARGEAFQAPSGQAGSPPSPASGGREDTHKVIADLERQWDDAVRRRDADALRRLMTEDFVLLSPFRASWNANRDAHAKGFADLKAREGNAAPPHELTDMTVNVTGDTAVVAGTALSTHRASQGPTKERGRYIHVWQKRGGQWLMVADHWDSEGIQPASLKAAPVDTAKLAGYAGKYDSGWPDALSVTTTAEGLVFKVESEGGWTETFVPASSTEFFGKTDPGTRAIFVRDDSGRVSEVIVLFHGRATRARKVASGS
jgi:ketosteroid isomerase-like protein